MSALLRPEPVAADAEVTAIDGNARYREVEEWLTRGRRVCITDTYGTALTLYSWLKRQVQGRSPAADYRTHRMQRQLLWRLTHSLLLPVEQHRIALRKAPPIPWLERLYPDLERFLLPLPDVLGLNGSWQWYSRGVRYGCLEQLLHPYHGVHFSTRDEHLALFDEYLDQGGRRFGCGVDVGAGMGALTFLLIKHAVSEVYATDTNPNAVASLTEDLERHGLSERATVSLGDLFGTTPPADLIAFNPPWLPGETRVTVDSGSFYPDDLLPRFFAAAAAHLRPGGRLVVLFSNFAELAGLTAANPVAEEVESGGRFVLVDRRERAVAPPARRRGRGWLEELRSRERVQLWELAAAGGV